MWGGGGEGGRVLQNSSDRDGSKDFGGFEIFDFGIFLGRKILASIFLVAWFK